MVIWVALAECPKQQSVNICISQQSGFSNPNQNSKVEEMFPNVVTDSVGHPFTCIPCQANHRVGLKFVIASVTPCVITQRAGCHCVRVIAAIAPVCHRIPHAIYHIAICTRLYYIQCFIVWRLAGQTYRLHDTVILRIQQVKSVAK